jgi:uroporphyrinogen-III decarboxylase
MTPRERFLAALDRKPLTGRVPHFELVFFLTMEAFGKLHPCQRNYSQWDQMEEKERRLHRADIADVLIRTAERFEHGDLGFYTIKHTDGNIMPIVDQIVQTGPHAPHSLDPQGGVDIAEVKRRVGRDLCLIGNVNCGLMDTGTDEQVRESARYALKHGMPGGGYIFSTSNCVYTGMKL